MVTINEVYRVKHVEGEEDAFIIEANITAIPFGSETPETFDCVSCTRPGPTDGFNQHFQQWLADNPDFPRDPFVPPTDEEKREYMKPLTTRQFRIGLVRGGISLDAVTAAIDSLPAGPVREEARIEWEYATTFNRTHPLVIAVSAELGLTPEQVDTMWVAAENL